ncbi:hypothetical protein PUMCH_002634 [Australozyma saopauloensis]|uniref:Uncharacterized protein n=1 Tax=Australozyma saopauloensis TaxID=291208 RepID=A0AAX4H9Y1_9ASCO|nr:hypothetical protein PUMCH_002634 [[Candida] saopauloensis]
MKFTSVVLSSLLLSSLSNASSLPKDYEIVEVKDIEEAQKRYSSLLGKKYNQMVFRLLDSGTFLTRRVQEYWDVEETLQELQYGDTLSSDLRLQNLYKNSRLSMGLKKKFKDRPIPYVEFFYSDFAIERSNDLLPVSPCHSEILGEGSVVKVQLTEITRATPQGKIGVPNFLQLILSTGEADLEVERENLLMMSLKCNVDHGEVGQIFLSHTEFLYFNTWYRTVWFDPNTGTFTKPEDFQKRPRERMVMKYGIGEWYCVTSKLRPLKCQEVVTDITDPLDVPAKNPTIEDTTKDEEDEEKANHVEQCDDCKRPLLHPAKLPTIYNMSQYQALKKLKGFTAIWPKERTSNGLPKN